MNCIKIGKKCSVIMSGFKLNSRRFSIRRLQAKFLTVFKFLQRWRSSNGNCFQASIKRSIGEEKGGTKMSCYGRNWVMKDVIICNNIVNDYRLKTYGRSNSFYSEAIADCLDFIKRNSIALNEKPVLQL